MFEQTKHEMHELKQKKKDLSKEKKVTRMIVIEHRAHVRIERERNLDKKKNIKIN